MREALDRSWVLDIDASIKPLYGRLEGAEIGYDPAKPMRPKHVLHTLQVNNLRLVLDELGSRSYAATRAMETRTSWAIGRAGASPNCCDCG